MIATSYRYIVQRAGVRSGHPVVEGTRIGVHDVVGLLQNGETIESLLVNCFPTLTRAQVYECLAYYEDHKGEIDVLVARQTAASARFKGHGQQLIEWLLGRAREEGCQEFHLDSGVQRFEAHGFYLKNRLHLVAHHFRRVLS